MLVKEKYFPFNAQKNKSLNFFFVISISAKAESNKEIIQKIASRFDDINNIQFDFIQTNNELIEKGSCFLSYTKKLVCRYLGDEQKEIIIKNNTLIVIKKNIKKFITTVWLTLFLQPY
ncbi:hypothetical protein SAR11G3_00414 [Candidatus Pelagibacter sp. IMCC9063]|uniref:hypothetical protein n=1 Tax=Pelagibacter sp. (strain IMCC9063) TaxID=1002672 RepID=UPI0002046798|nr:hypothetical protein [Candidatus Pelagibacter sp. IMCC9063]AEA80889.1 hypothetical protein SAR11G3_00414 [Candidatus Pelagibacter sp. IMCC9063]